MQLDRCGSLMMPGDKATAPHPSTPLVVERDLNATTVEAFELATLIPYVDVVLIVKMLTRPVCYTRRREVGEPATARLWNIVARS